MRGFEPLDRVDPGIPRRDQQSVQTQKDTFARAPQLLNLSMGT